MSIRSSKYFWGSLIVMAAFTSAAQSRGEIPEGPLGFVAVLLFLVMMGIGTVLDSLDDIKKRLSRLNPPAQPFDADDE